MTTIPVTLGNSEVGSSDFEETPVALQSAGPTTQTRKSALTDGDWWAALADRAAAYVTPPSVLTEPPPSVVQLAAYAKGGAWTGRRSGFVRGFGVWWFRLVALPITARCRFREWVWQRPGRAITVLLLAKLLASSTWGSWAVDHLIHPAVEAAIWLFL